MIRKLQKRFIVVAMTAVTIVLAIIMVAINLINYITVTNFADDVLDNLVRGNGQFLPQPAPPKDMRPPSDKMTGETRFETRYFSVILDNNHEAVKIDTTHIFAVDQTNAVLYSQEVLTTKRTSGYLDIYRYRKELTESGTLIIFIDCSKQLMTVKDFLIGSIIVSGLGMVAVTLVVILLSKRAILPIAKSYEKQKSFVTDASHELKTPLTIISANNEILELEVGTNEYTRMIAKQVERMATMTKNLLLLSKISEDDFKNECEKFVLTDAIIDVTDSFRTVISDKRVFEVTIDNNINYYGNEKLIRQMIFILLDNAYKYSQKAIYVKISSEKGRIMIECRNDCEGVEIGNLNKYCDRFYRSAISRASSIEGSGIGLSIAKEIIDMHKGKLTLSSKTGHDFIAEIEL